MSAVANWMRGWNMLLNKVGCWIIYGFSMMIILLIWRKDLQDYHGGWAALLDNSLFCIPVEYRERYPLHVAKNKTREIIKKAGKLLCACHEMLAAAHT